MDSEVYIEVAPSAVNYVNRILESYEYLGILTTINAKRATCVIHSTADTRADVVDVLMSLTDVDVKLLQNREEAVS